jgi:hypothetical protein
MSSVEEQFYEITSCELPHDYDTSLTLEDHLNIWFLEQISSIEEDIVLVKKRMINASDSMVCILNHKLDSLKSELDSLRRRKFSSKGIIN